MIHNTFFKLYIKIYLNYFYVMYILEHDSFLSHIAFTVEAKYHIFVYASRQTVLFGAVNSPEHLEHEVDSPKFNM
jgi:hypothetical protein